jgi:phosphomevalonate kinase
MATLKVPGKLFLMGEYSVVSGDSPALILPTERTLTVTVQASEKWELQSSLEPSIKAATFEAFMAALPSPLLIKIITYLKESYPLSTPLSWTIESQLDDTHHAYGLGSSGALTVAMIGATALALNQPLTPFELFKASVNAQNDPFSSYGDLAVSVMQKPLYYRRPKTVNDTFEGFRLEPFELSFNYHVVHSGLKVSSSPLVQAYLNKKDSPAVKTYIQTINTLIENFYKTPSLSLIKAAQDAYETMAHAVDETMVPPALKAIITTIHDSGGIAKISGAGGGDNVLAFYPTADALEKSKPWFKNYILL